jgi:hypothetical protein
LFPILPDIEQILQIISNLRKWNFKPSEFNVEYQKYVNVGTVTEKNYDRVLDILFNFSVIGNQHKTKKEIQYFKYMYTNMNLNRNENLVIHRGLFKSLRII